MNHRDIAVLMDGIAPVLRGYVEKAFEPIGARMLALEQRFNDLPAPRDGRDADPVLILRLVEETVAKVPAAPAGVDGKDADPDLVAELVERAVAALPPAKAGEQGPAGEGVTAEQLAPLVAEAVAREVEKLILPVGPVGEKGEPGEPGKTISVDDLAPVVADAVAKAAVELREIAANLPSGKDGLPGAAGEPGKSVTVEDLTPVIENIVVMRVAEIPTAKDGLDGKEGIPGRDGRDGLPGVQGEKGIDGRHGADGRDGLGIEDFDVRTSDEGRTLEFSLKREGAHPIIKQVPTGAVIDRGVWREQAYTKGDGVTWAGSFFIAKRETAPNEKPGEVPEAFRLAVKRGRDGRDGKDGKSGLNGKDGKDGRDGKSWA